MCQGEQSCLDLEEQRETGGVVCGNSFLDPPALVMDTHLYSPYFSLASTMETVPKCSGGCSVSEGPGKNQRWVPPQSLYFHPIQYKQEKRTQY